MTQDADNPVDRRTWRTIGTIGAIVVITIGALGTIFSWRQEDRDRLASFERVTTEKLVGIDNRLTGLSYEFQLFKQSVEYGADGKLTKSDMRLWLYKARGKYPELPDLE